MRSRVVATLVAAACTGFAAAQTAPPAGVAWDDAFATGREPAAIHYRASYRGSDGREHRLEVWRSGTQFLRRRTDDRMDLYVVADASAGGGLRYRILDHARRAMIDVDRVNLMRIGVFSDWDALAHVVAQPRNGYRIAPRQTAAAASDEPCITARLEPAGVTRASNICWSARWGLPVRIDDGAPGSVASFELRSVEALAPGDLPAQLPSLPEGYEYIDSNIDIDPNGD